MASTECHDDRLMDALRRIHERSMPDPTPATRIPAMKFPSHVKPIIELHPETIAALDPGIRDPVQILNAYGIQTFQSCQGGEGHCYPEPTIEFDAVGQLATEGFKALDVCHQWAIPIYELRRVWHVRDGVPVGPIWQIILSRPWVFGN